MKFYKKLDLPKVPSDLLKFEFKPRVSYDSLHYDTQHVRGDEILQPIKYDSMIITHQPLLDYINSIITEYDMNLFEITKVSDGQFVPHIDSTRAYSLNYYLTLGGSNATTSWYQENGKPVIRPKPGYVSSQTPDGSVSYKDLKQLDSVKFQENTWYLMRANVIHDVGPIVGTREFISVSIYNELKNNDLGDIC